MPHHIAHELHHRAIEGLILGLQFTQSRDQASHLVMLRDALVDEVGIVSAHRRIEDFLLELGVNLERGA